MEPSSILTLLMFVALGGLLMAGYPVAFTLAGVALGVACLGLFLNAQFGVDVGVLDAGYVGLFPERIVGIMMNEVLLAVPLFIAMGVVLEKSRVAEDLLEAMGQLFGSIRGGLGISVTIVGALLAASTGIVGATVVTMGLLSLPTMLRRGYDPALAAGSIAAAGTLGQIIPPSIVLVLLADVLSSAWQDAQRTMGVWSPEPLSVGDLFAGALIPGLGLVGLYILYQIIIAILRPEACPPPQSKAEDAGNRGAFYARLLAALMPPMTLMVGVLGSILAGVATPTEAAAVGAIGAILLGAFRLNTGRSTPILASIAALIALLVIAATGGVTDAVARIPAVALALVFAWGLLISIRSLLRHNILGEALQSTVRISTMIFAILIGAALFSLVFRGLGGDQDIADLLSGLPGGAAGAVLAVMIVMFLLGFFLDFIEITFVVVPIIAPVLFMMGVHPVWLGIMMAVNLQTSFLTPPFGFALFYLRGVAPPEITTMHLYKGVLPFVIIQLVALGLLAAFPALATWLPDVMFG